MLNVLMYVHLCFAILISSHSHYVALVILIYSTLEAEEENFPKILNKFIKQKYTINLSIHQDNLKKGSTVYHANEILYAQEKGDSFDQNSATVVDVRDFSLVNVCHTCYLSLF